MEIIDGNPLAIRCQPNEEVTVVVNKSVGIHQFVNYSLDGGPSPGPIEKSTPVKFTVDKKRKLGVLINYAETSGGSFEMRVTGSAGGGAAFADDQANGEHFDLFVFAFTVA